MQPIANERTAARPGRPSWGSRADAVGHCLLVFAFLPALAVLPGWLYGEAHNALNVHHPIVLAFLPARGALAMLDAFGDGITGRLLAGILAGVLLCLLAPRHGAETTTRRVVLGALCGALGACATVVTMAAIGHAPGSLVFELAGAIVCGAVAAPGAVRLLRAAPQRGAATAPDAPQRRDASPSASHQ